MNLVVYVNPGIIRQSNKISFGVMDDQIVEINDGDSSHPG
jgi:hypothetical protein